MDTKAMFAISYGLYVLGVNDGDHPSGCIINTASQLCDTPATISVTVNKANHTHDVLLKTKEMTLSVLDESVPFNVFERFGFQSGKDVHKFEGYDNYDVLDDGTPYLTKHDNAYISGKVVKTVNLPTHTLFIIEVSDAKVLNDMSSVTYDYYFKHIKPAPVKKKGWVCKICGYVYEGDELPADFICPLCKHGAADFEPIG